VGCRNRATYACVYAMFEIAHEKIGKLRECGDTWDTIDKNYEAVKDRKSYRIEWFATSETSSLGVNREWYTNLVQKFSRKKFQ